MNDIEPILRIVNVTKEFPLSKKGSSITACNSLSIDIPRGKTFGIVGESGCGKSTLAKIIVQMLSPTSGSVFFNNEDVTKLTGEKARKNRQHIQMVFQDPSTAFNPKMRVKEIICEPLRNFHLLKKKDVSIKAKELLQSVGLPESFAERYPHSMSGGQRQRIGIARALALEPEVIVLDEATSALDVSLQKNIMELLMKLQQEKGLTYILICHDVSLVNQYSDEITIMYLGSIMEQLKDIKKGCLHPYSKALLDAIFSIDKNGEKNAISLLEGEIPSAINTPSGCPFHTRCTKAWNLCLQEKPQRIRIAEDHLIACHLYT